MNALHVSDVTAPESDLSSANESCDLLDVVVGGKSLYERNHDHNPFNDGFQGGSGVLRYDGPGPYDRPFVDEPGPRR